MSRPEFFDVGLMVGRNFCDEMLNQRVDGQRMRLDSGQLACTQRGFQRVLLVVNCLE